MVDRQDLLLRPRVTEQLASPGPRSALGWGPVGRPLDLSACRLWLGENVLVLGCFQHQRVPGVVLKVGGGSVVDADPAWVLPARVVGSGLVPAS